MRVGSEYFVFLDDDGRYYKCTSGMKYGNAVFLVRTDKGGDIDKLLRHKYDILANCTIATDNSQLEKGGQALQKYLEAYKLDNYYVGVGYGGKLKADIIIPNEKEMCYEVYDYSILRHARYQNGQVNMTEKPIERKRYFDPNLREIKDLKFYHNMTEFYKTTEKDFRKSDEYINGYFLADFLYSYHKGIDPITKMPLTLEQAEELASFTEVVAAHHTVNEFYTYPLHFTEYCNAAKDIVKMVREREKTDPRRN